MRRERVPEWVAIRHVRKKKHEGVQDGSSLSLISFLRRLANAGRTAALMPPYQSHDSNN